MEDRNLVPEAQGKSEAVGFADPSPYPLPQGEGKQQQGLGDASAPGEQRQVLGDASAPGEQLQVLDAPVVSQDQGNQQKTAAVPQIWQQVSGLRPETEAGMTRSERRLAIRKLFREFERRAREALSEHEKDEEAGERTYLWTPLESICFELGIARRKLSALTKELTGMSAQEVIDRVRAESLREKIATQLKPNAELEFLRFFEAEEKSYRRRATPREFENWEIKNRPDLFQKEKDSARAKAEAGMRNEPDCGWAKTASDLMAWVWDRRRSQPAIAWATSSGAAARQQFARELGFSTYQRLYRACLLSCGKSPMEVEHAVVLQRLEELEREHAPRRDEIRTEMLKN